MKIKLKIEAYGFPADTELEVDDSQARQMIQDGDAVEVKQSKRNTSNKALTAPSKG